MNKTITALALALIASTATAKGADLKDLQTDLSFAKLSGACQVIGLGVSLNPDGASGVGATLLVRLVNTEAARLGMSFDRLLDLCEVAESKVGSAYNITKGSSPKAEGHLVVAKFLGGCGMLGQAVKLQEASKFEGGEMFIGKWAFTHAASMDMTPKAFTSLCAKAETTYQQIFNGEVTP